jgi:excinuclease UvrABC helicase subunit UvrB
MNKEKIQEKITELEARMTDADFWIDKNKAQEVINEIKKLKEEKSPMLPAT